MSDEKKGDPGQCKTEAVTNALHENRRQRELAVQRMRQFTGRCYPKLEAELYALSIPALLDLVRLVTDGQQEVTRAKRQAIHEPWRRG